MNISVKRLAYFWVHASLRVRVNSLCVCVCVCLVSVSESAGLCAIFKRWLQYCQLRHFAETLTVTKQRLVLIDLQHHSVRTYLTCYPFRWQAFSWHFLKTCIKTSLQCLMLKCHFPHATNLRVIPDSYMQAHGHRQIVPFMCKICHMALKLTLLQLWLTRDVMIPEVKLLVPKTAELCNCWCVVWYHRLPKEKGGEKPETYCCSVNKRGWSYSAAALVTTFHL